MIRYFKAFVSVVLILACVFSMSISVAAAGSNTGDNSSFILKETVARGESVPSRSWNFGNGDYSGSFSGLRTGLYTNRYFTGSTSYTIEWDVENTGPAISGAPNDDVTFVIRIYDITDRTWDDVYESDELHATSNPRTDDGSKTVRGLNSSHRYAFYFVNGLYETDDSASQLRGDITVSN